MNEKGPSTKIGLNRFVTVALAAQLASALSAVAAEEGMFEFVPSYDSPENVVNMSHLLSAPAGKDGTSMSCRSDDGGRGGVVNEGVSLALSLPVPAASVGPSRKTVWYELSIEK